MGKARDIDSKFAVSTDGQIFKKSDKEVVPEDEPLFLLRGRDILAVKLLLDYVEISKKAGCNGYHFLKLGETVQGFVDFANKHPERMKMPSITEGGKLRRFYRGPGGALLSDVEIPGVTQTLDGETEKGYGGRFFVGETLSTPACVAIAKALGGVFDDKEKR